MRFHVPVLIFVLSLVSIVGATSARADTAPAVVTDAVSLRMAPKAVQPDPVEARAEAAGDLTPPQWAYSILLDAQALPVVGPVISKTLLYAGIASSILTMLVAFLIGSMTALASVFNYAGLTSAVQAITVFQKGPVIYWLKFFSLFNAKKPDAL